MKTTTQPRQLGALSVGRFGCISPPAFIDSPMVAQIFGRSVEQAAQALRALGKATEQLKDKTEVLSRAMPMERPWYQRGRW